MKRVILIILLAVFFRFIYLNSVPNAVNGDELHYMITAKSVALTGRDVSGTWNPLSAFIFRYPPGEQQAELLYFLHLPFSGPFPFSLFLAKLPFAILSVGIVLLLYDISRRLFGGTVGIATGLIAAVNPWLVVMGRTGYESTPATFFYLLAIRTLLSENSWGILWSLIPFTLAFYSYIGTKLIFIPFVLLSVILTYRKQKRHAISPYIVLILSCVAITAGYFILLKASPAGSRMSELMLPSSPAVVAQVNEIRRTSIQSPLLPFLVNKYAASIQIILSKLFRIFSPTYLFLEGDQFFLPARQSFFYYVDFLFMMWGALSLFTKKRKYFLILALFIVIGTLPHLLHSTVGDFSGHLALMFPFMIIFIGAGIADCIDHLNGRLKPFALGLLSIVYTLNVASFSLIYFFQYPLVGAGDFPMRTLTRYLALAKNENTPITVYSMRKGDLFKKYLFYSNAMTAKTLPEISRLHTQFPFTFNQIHFTDCDAGVMRTNNPIDITIYDHDCAMKIEGASLKISSLLDGGQKYAIVNDSVCNNLAVNTYPKGIRIIDFSIEQLSKENFCKTFITR